MSEEDRIVNELLERNGKIRLARKVYKLENIIKEVREYVKAKMEIRKNCENIYDYCIRNDDYIKQVDELLEILEKESNK